MTTFAHSPYLDFFGTWHLNLWMSQYRAFVELNNDFLQGCASQLRPSRSAGKGPVSCPRRGQGALRCPGRCTRQVPVRHGRRRVPHRAVPGQVARGCAGEEQEEEPQHIAVVFPVRTAPAQARAQGEGQGPDQGPAEERGQQAEGDGRDAE